MKRPSFPTGKARYSAIPPSGGRLKGAVCDKVLGMTKSPDLHQTGFETFKGGCGFISEHQFSRLWLRSGRIAFSSRTAGRRARAMLHFIPKYETKTIDCHLMPWAAVARRSQRRMSRIAKGLRTRCYSALALARIAKGDGRSANETPPRWTTITWYWPC